MHLKDVLEKLNSARVTLNPMEAQIVESRISLLGFTIDIGKVPPSAEKLRTILLFPATADVSGLCRFGMVNFYRPFIPNNAATQAPLTTLLRKSVSCSWGPEQETAFCCLSKALTDTASMRVYLLRLAQFQNNAPIKMHRSGATMHVLGGAKLGFRLVRRGAE